jgi:hypothetical protein
MSALTGNPARRARGYIPLRLVTHRRSAVSVAAQSVYNAASGVADSGEQSEALFGPKLAAISQIWALVHESCEVGGESVQAEPISLAAAERATDFVRALPEDVSLPEFAWDPDGSISLDWIQSRHRLLSVSVGEGYRLPYAWLDGADQGHGVVTFDGETVPARILEDIRRIMQRGSAAVRPT